MDIEDFAVQYPCPPPGKGEKTHTTSIRITESEFNAISEILSDRRTNSMFGRSASSFLRWLIYYEVARVKTMLDSNRLDQLALLMDAELGAYNAELRVEEVKGFVATRARQLSSLLSMPDEAMKLYERTLDFCYGQPAPVSKLLLTSLYQSPEIDRFRTEMLKYDALLLREIETPRADEEG